jgi:single-strand selective monofunctional uracil DNA glycosylase
MMMPSEINDALVKAIGPLQFRDPVSHVYNPLDYARKAHDLYYHRYGGRPKEIVLLGMNPGPWGMAQTGIPFGDASAVKDWLHIEAPIGRPLHPHPKRPVQGFHCPRSEISGRRLWGWAKKQFKTPEKFFSRFFVANYCPLAFMEATGKNRTPDRLNALDKEALFAACDLALNRLIQWYLPRHVLGVGNFAEKRAHIALKGLDVQIGKITHPSPANPKANRGWEAVVNRELRALGISL